MNLKNILFRLIFVLTFSIASFPIYCDWDPSASLKIDKEIVTDALSKPDLVSLKKKVFDYLVNSWCSKEKANLIMDLVILKQPMISVEIGIFTGSSLLPIVAGLSYTNTGYAYAIDPWSSAAAVKGIPRSDGNYAWWSTVSMLDARKVFMTMINEWDFNSFYTLYYARSNHVDSHFDRIDFLHLDGNFSEEGSYEDVELYLPKVALGGYILLSNAFAKVDNEHTKMKSIWLLLDHCEVIAEIENSNTILFQKN